MGSLFFAKTNFPSLFGHSSTLVLGKQKIIMMISKNLASATSPFTASAYQYTDMPSTCAGRNQQSQQMSMAQKRNF